MTTRKLASVTALAIVFAAISSSAQSAIDRHAVEGASSTEYFHSVVPRAKRTRTARHAKHYRHKHNTATHRKRYYDVNHVASIPRPPRDVPDGCRSGVRALDCLVPELAAKGKEIVAACGSRVTSAVAGRGYKSNHPIRRAVDLADNPACIYAHLKGWRGGYSTDYHSAPGGQHVHVSWNPGGQEWGVRFVHGGHRTHYAGRRHRVRYAHAR